MKKIFLNFLSLGIIICFSQCTSSNNNYSITDFGAVSDTTVLSTQAVQKAIDKCSEKGGRVVVPVGKFVIGTIILKSNVELYLSEGSELLGSISLDDYSENNIGAIEAPAFNKCLIYAESKNNLKISGQGIINGRGFRKNFPVKITGNELGERPMLIRFVNCNQIVLSGVSLFNSASWCTHLVDCDNIVAQGITIDSHVNTNNDGFDLDGCKNMLIENCSVRSGDDAICPKSTTTRITEDITVRNCRVISNTAAFKCGTSSRGGFRNIYVSDCDFSDTKMGAIKLLLVDGGVMENIQISNIIMNNVEGPVFIRLGNRGRKYNVPTEQIQGKNVANEGIPAGILKNIRIANIKATVESTVPKRCGIMISGVPGHYVQDVVLENIDISFPGGGTLEDAKRIVAEDEARYPEQFFFGTLPSWGAFIRHAKNIRFKNVHLVAREKDMRERIILDDVLGFVEE